MFSQCYHILHCSKGYRTVVDFIPSSSESFSLPDLLEKSFRQSLFNFTGHVSICMKGLFKIFHSTGVFKVSEIRLAVYIKVVNTGFFQNWWQQLNLFKYKPLCVGWQYILCPNEPSAFLFSRTSRNSNMTSFSISTVNPMFGCESFRKVTNSARQSVSWGQIRNVNWGSYRTSDR